MSAITLEIREDLSHREGGHAVILIKGLNTKPDNGAFVIEPAASAIAAADLKGWPRGTRRPLKTTMSNSGFEIVVGPDVVESPVLLPGTPVVIKVPAAGVTLEALWPDITPLRREKVKRIITSSERRDALARAQSNVTSIDAGPRAAATPDQLRAPTSAAMANLNRPASIDTAPSSAAGYAQGTGAPAPTSPTTSQGPVVGAIAGTASAPISETSAGTGTSARISALSPKGSAIDNLMNGTVSSVLSGSQEASPGISDQAERAQSGPQTKTSNAMTGSATAQATAAPAVPAAPAAPVATDTTAPGSTASTTPPIGHLSKLNLASDAGKRAAPMPSGNDNETLQSPSGRPTGIVPPSAGVVSVSSRGMAPKAVATLANTGGNSGTSNTGAASTGTASSNAVPAAGTVAEKGPAGRAVSGGTQSETDQSASAAAAVLAAAKAVQDKGTAGDTALPKRQEDMLVAALSQEPDAATEAPANAAPANAAATTPRSSGTAPASAAAAVAKSGAARSDQSISVAKSTAPAPRGGQLTATPVKAPGTSKVASAASAAQPASLQNKSLPVVSHDKQNLPAKPTRAGGQSVAITSAAIQNAASAHKDSEPVPQVRDLRAQRPSQRGRISTWLSGMASGLVAAMVLFYGYVSVIGWPNLSAIGLPPVHTAGAMAHSDEGLAIYEALKVGSVSPRGIFASTVEPEAAINRADGSLRVGVNGRARDTDEGAFWFKHYLSRQIGDRRTTWALTQLGTTYAQPVEGTPDYKKAQVLWEAAAALGDPYAACFLGKLFEHGLGVAVSRDMALTWYLRARSAGGCRSLDQSIARLGG